MGKKVIALTAVLSLIFASAVFANESKDSCDDGWYSKVANRCVGHPDQDNRRSPLGVGADVVLYEGSKGKLLKQVHGEYRYDFQNNEHSLFAIATTSLKDVLGFVQGLWNRSGE